MSTTTLPLKPASRLWRACFIWGLATLFYFYDNLLQVTPSAMKTELFSAFVDSDEGFGSLSAYCLYAYGIMQIPAGLLVDKYGPRRLLTVACVLCAGGSLVFGWASSLVFAKLARVLIGVGASFAVVCCLKVVSIWFKPRHFGLLTGMTVTVGMLGAVCSLSTVGYFVSVLGWREAMLYGGVFGLGLSVLIWFLVHDKKEHHHNQTQKNSTAKINTDPTQTIQATLQGMWRDLSEVMKSRQAWLVATYAGLMFVPTLAFGGLWGIPFMQEVHGLDRMEAGLSVSLIYVGWMFGGPLYGWVAAQFNSERTPMLFANAATLIVCALLIYSESLPLLWMQVLLFLTGFFSSGFILAFTVIRKHCPSHLAGTSVGFTNALNTLGGAMAQPLIGWVLDLSGKQYQIALSILPVCLILAWVCLVSVKEQKPSASVLTSKAFASS